jgi:hypothetical protein
MYTKQEMDFLALRGAETLCFKPGAASEYDVEHYKRIPRRFTDFGKHKYYETEPLPIKDLSSLRDLPSKLGKLAGDRPYLLRMGGFRRASFYRPDEIGGMLRVSGVQYADGIGNGLFENLLLCRKYGIWPVFEAPALGFSLPFLKTDFPAFKRFYRKKILKMRRDLEIVEHILGRKIAKRKNQPWVLWLRYSPLALYFHALEENHGAVADEMEASIGIKRAPVGEKTVEERAAFVRFWSYLRRRHAELLLLMSEIFREEIVGGGIIMGNMHANPIVDYLSLPRIFDFPGLAIRPGYLEEKSLHSSYIAYTIGLLRDLTGKLPVISVRSNLLSSGIRFIPGINALNLWYSIAVRAGVSGFYFWPRDYPSSEGPSGYDGPMCGNPDPSAMGKERWQTNLDIFSKLRGVRVFNPPQAEVAIMVCCDSLDVEGWEKVFRTFHLFESARIRTKFIDISVIERNIQKLAPYKLVVVPTLTLCSSGGVECLKAYLESGGRLLSGDKTLGEADFEGRLMNPGFTYLEMMVNVDEVDTKPPFVWHEPRLVTPTEENTSGGMCREEFRSLTMKLRKLCSRLSIDPQEWVYDVSVDNVGSVSGKISGYDEARSAPELVLEHYFYEHSSDWILPDFEHRKEDSYR